MRPSLKPLLDAPIGTGNRRKMQALWNLGLPQITIRLAVTRVLQLPRMAIAPLLLIFFLFYLFFRVGSSSTKESCSWQGHKAAHHRYQAKCEEALHGEDVRAEEVGGATCTHTHTSQTDTSPTPYTSSLSLSFPCSSMHTRTGRPTQWRGKGGLACHSLKGLPSCVRPV